MRGHRVRLAILLALLAGWAVLVAACGGSEATTTTQELSTAGGTAALGDDVTVHFPPGTLSGPTTVTITRASDENAPPQALEAADAIGDAFKIDIGDQELDGPVTIEFPYAEDALPDGTGNDEIFLAYFDDELDVWVPVAGEVDPERNIIAVQTDHLSWWNPWTWNWDAWMAVLNQTLMLRVTDFFDAVAVLVDDCPQSGATVTVDASDANNVVQGCVERDDPAQPKLRVVNPKSFFFEVNSGAHGYFPPTLLGPAESLPFDADTSHGSPLVVNADITQAAGVHLVMHLVLQMLPGGSQLLSQNGIVTCLAETLSNLAPIASAVEALVVHRDGAAAAEALLELYSNLASAEAFISAADGCGAPVASSWTGTAFGQLATGARVTATIMSATDFVANFLLNSHSEVQFNWAQPTMPPTPIPSPTPPAASAYDLIVSRIQAVYAALSSGDYLAVWNNYSSAFQSGCSFDAMVAFIDQYRLSAGWDQLQAHSINVAFRGNFATASYSLVLLRNGAQIDQLAYELDFVRDGGTWRAAEVCY